MLRCISMLSVFDVLIVGLVATLTMDIVGGATRSFGLVRLQPIGRWVLYLLKGKFRHKDISKANRIRGESLLSPIVHYGIGITLASFYLLLLELFSLGQGSIFTALVYGLATNTLPLIVMFPSMGYGIGGFSYSPKIFLLRQSLITHVAFGLGLWLGVSLSNLV